MTELTEKSHSYIEWGVFTTVIAGLMLWGMNQFLMFHSIIEIMRVVVSVVLCVVAWNSRGFTKNPLLTNLGIAFLFVAIIDMMHTFTYKGVHITHYDDANIPTQLWIAARYLESLAILGTFLFWKSSLNYLWVFGANFVFTVTVLVSILVIPVFPDAFVEGRGLTSFKVASEFVITGILGASLWVMRKNRKQLSPDLYRIMLFAILFAAGAEMTFTLYKDVYGVSNMLGHILKLVSVYLIYKAAIVHVLTKPYESLYKDIERQRRQLMKTNQLLLEESHKRELTLEELGKLNTSLQQSEIKLKQRINQVEVKYRHSVREASEVILKKADLAQDMARLATEVNRLREENEILREQLSSYTRMVEQASVDIHGLGKYHDGDYDD